MALPEEVEEGDLESLGALKEHYAKGKDGKFRPVGKGGSTLVVETKLISALEKERGLRRTAESDLGAYKELGDHDTIREAMRHAEASKNWKPDEKVQELIKAQVSQVVTAKDAEIGKRDSENKKIRDLLNKKTLVGDALAAMQRAKVRPEYVDALLPSVLSKLRGVEVNGDYVTRVYSDEGNEKLSADGTPMKVDELVDSFRSKWGDFFQGTGSSGGGAGAGGGGGTQHNGVLLIKNSDHRAKSENMERIAAGTARVVPD